MCQVSLFSLEKCESQSTQGFLLTDQATDANPYIPQKIHSVGIKNSDI